MKAAKLLVVALVPVLLALKSPDFPSTTIKKELYAKNDFRGKPFKQIQWGQTVLGQIPSKQEMSGKVLLIDLWATWCGPCRAVIPEMNKWAKKFEKDLVIVGVSDEKPEVIQEFAKATPMNYAVTSDSTKSMSKALGVAGIPHVIVMSKDGVVRYQGFPLQEEDKLTTEKLAQIIEANKALK
ncbi:MAG TPA: TlpA disulfide reductase family protein [Fimbriimonas sp.]|nr:TlpA disulfide reductase family protein [Fimbriimonas sp.]